jgi:hypothetical protein
MRFRLAGGWLVAVSAENTSHQVRMVIVAPDQVPGKAVLLLMK